MPPFDPQKHSPSQSLHQFAGHAIDGALDLLSKSVPCTVDDIDDTGTVVMVKVEIEDPNVVYPLIQCPVYGPEYLRWPLKKGDKGVMLSADYYIAEMSGLGTGKADLTPQFNLSMGIFFPIGNTNFGATEDAKKTVIYGPEGVLIKGCPIPPKEDTGVEPNFTDTSSSNGGSVELPPAFGGGVVPTTRQGRANVELPPAFGGGSVDTGGNGANVPAEKCGALVVDKDGITSYGQGDEAGNYTTINDEGFKVYIGGQLKLVVDGAGMRWVGGNPIPGSGGRTYGINVTPSGTHIDDVNFLPHMHKGVTVGTSTSGPVDDTLSPP